MKEIGAKMDISTPEHLQLNGMCEKKMYNLVKITYAAIAENKQPDDLLQSFLRKYRTTPHVATGKSPLELLIGRNISNRIPALHDIKPKKKTNGKKV